MAICQRAKTEKTAKYWKILKFDFKVAKNKAFLGIITLLNNSLLDKNNINLNNNKANDWKNKLEKNKFIFKI